MTGWPGPVDEATDHVATDILAALEQLAPGSGRLPDGGLDAPSIPAALVRGILDLIRLPEGARAGVAGPAAEQVRHVVEEELEGLLVTSGEGGDGTCALVVVAAPARALGEPSTSADAPSSDTGLHPLQPVIDEAVRLLAPTGVLLVLVEAPHGIARRLLGGSNAAATSDPRRSIDGLTRALEHAGLPAHDRLVPYLDDPVALLLVLAATAERVPPPADLVTALRGDPLGSHPARERFLGDPWTAGDPGRDIDPDGSAADTIVLVAARERAALERRMPEGASWLVRHPAATTPAWRSARRVVVADDRWELRPFRRRPATSGPYAVPDRGARLPPGRDGERLMATALAEDGPDGPRTAGLVTRWWAVAERIIGRASGEERPVELPPRDFLVDADGAWWPMGGGVVARVPVPETVVAFGGLLRTVEVTIRSRWITRVDPDLAISDIVAVLMAHAGLELTDPTRYLWAEIEADLRRRTGRTTLPARELRAGLVERTEKHLSETVAALPLPSRVRAVAEIHGARREAALAAHHETLRTELTALGFELARLREAAPSPAGPGADPS